MKNFFALLILVFYFLPTKIRDQEITTFECPETVPAFEGVAVQTLCEDFGTNFDYDQKIGVGTQYLKSSQVGGSFTIFSGNILIVGDFEIDNPAVFHNAIVKILPGAAIKVSHVSTGNIVSLRIQNSKFFACDGLWKGILLSGETRIVTSNNSIIEDAETAISATINDILSIEKTIFNRNVIGLNLNNPAPQSVGPKVIKLSKNKFSCTAPINGTVDKISEKAIVINHVSLFAETDPNYFENQEFGILMGGATSTLSAKFLEMKKIKRTGIRVVKGALKIKDSHFENFEEYGIDVRTATIVDVANTDFFLHNMAPSLFNRTGIQVADFTVNSIVNISTGCTFNMQMAYNSNTAASLARGIHLIGGNVAFGTTISIIDLLRRENSLAEVEIP